MNHKFFILVLAGLIIGLSSCQKDETTEPTLPQQPKTMKELQVPADFNWKTTRNIQASLTAKSNGLVEFLDAKGNAYQKAFLTANKPFVLKFTVPSAEKVLKVKFNGKVASVEITSDNLSVSLN